MSGPDPPGILATYRLQLHGGFPLARARDLAPYLHRLGVSHIHASPVLRSRTGSLHGYDVVDPGILDPELGDEAALDGLVTALREHGMGLVLDLVPNHMAASPENWRWEDVLAHGPASPYARWFDIEWRAAEPGLHQRVLIPILGEPRSAVLERGELRLTLTDGDLRLRYWEHRFPLDPATMPLVLEPALAACERDLGPDHPGTAELRAVLDLLERIPRRTARAAAGARRRRLAGEALRRLRKLCALTPEVRRRIERAATGFTAGTEGVERMRRLLDAQAYRLVHWRRAAREINYRRFFDVNDLVALHLEDPEVFAQTHALALDWIRSGLVDGLRIDHPDGLLDPLGYFQRLGERAFPDRAGPRPPLFVEKILQPGERLRDEWPVAGSTGYDFMNQVEALFLDPGGAAQVDRDYRRLVRRPAGFAAVAYTGKRAALESGLSAGVRRLAQRLQRLSDPAGPSPLPLGELATAIVETIAHLPVYRTYVDDRRPEPDPEDRALLEGAVAAARARGRAPARALDAMAAALLGTDPALRTPEREGPRRRFVQRFQQLSGPAAAKGVEDTAFYVYVPLLSRNEVGGDPDLPLAEAARALHQANAHRAACWPGTMLAVTTHDTKRSADVRARLDVLSELPVEWEERVYRWRRWNRPHRTMIRGRLAPDSNTEYLLYQTLVGAWPLELAGDASPGSSEPLDRFRERVRAYALKAAREAKTETSWVDPDPEFEAALDRFVGAILSPDRAPEFLRDLTRFVGRIARPGLWNALARTLVQLTAPGLPDLYQGDELWNFLLVDPDNRRPVDFDRRIALLDQIAAAAELPDPLRREYLADLAARPEDGRIKLHVVRSALLARREAPGIFAAGSYRPLSATGPAAAHLFGFLRRGAEGLAVTVVPRLIARHPGPGGSPPGRGFWEGTRVLLPDDPGAERWRDALTGEPRVGAAALEAADLFATLPVALLRNA